MTCFLSDLQIFTFVWESISYPLPSHDEILLMDFFLAVIYSSAKLWNCLSGNLRSRAQFHEIKTMIFSFDKFNIWPRNQVTVSNVSLKRVKYDFVYIHLIRWFSI